eukprot:1749406-Pleurochrysis_carterae.AAC.1
MRMCFSSHGCASTRTHLHANKAHARVRACPCACARVSARACVNGSTSRDMSSLKWNLPSPTRMTSLTRSPAKARQERHTGQSGQMALHGSSLPLHATRVQYPLLSRDSCGGKSRWRTSDCELPAI